MSGLIWIQTVRHPDGIEKIQHLKSKIWHINKVWRNNKSNIWKYKSWSKYTVLQICNFWTTYQWLIFVATLHFSSKWLQWLMAGRALLYEHVWCYAILSTMLVRLHTLCWWHGFRPHPQMPIIGCGRVTHWGRSYHLHDEISKECQNEEKQFFYCLS